MITRKLTVAAAAAFALSTAAMAAALPERAPQGKVDFVSGGVGDDEASALKGRAAGYPLQLQFVQQAQPRDEFLADVRVKISDRSGNVVLDTTASGPFLFANVPPGRYQVEAEYNGVVKRKSVDVRAGKQQKAMMVWAPSPEDARQSMAGDSDRSSTLR